MYRLLLVRHGETEGNSAERFWGQTDVGLSEAGFRQAERLGDRLASEDISLVYSSALCRALQTADIIASHHGLDVIACRELREIDFGSVEGMTYGEISQKYPDLVRSWFSWDFSFRFPDGESLADVNNRVICFLQRLEKNAEEETIVVTAHSGVLRLLICHLLGLELQHWRQIRLDLASLSVVETYSEAVILSLLNDVSHLQCEGG